MSETISKEEFEIQKERISNLEKIVEVLLDVVEGMQHAQGALLRNNPEVFAKSDEDV